MLTKLAGKRKLLCFCNVHGAVVHYRDEKGGKGSGSGLVISQIRARSSC